jgi:hypothetical protein
MPALRRVMSAVLLTLGAPAAAWACPVCGLAGTGDNTWAYGAMSFMLSAVPLGVIGGIVFWVSRRASKPDAAPFSKTP